MLIAKLFACHRAQIREETMSLADSKLVPAAFWVGFLALGFVTSLGGPDKHSQTARIHKSMKLVPVPPAALAGEIFAEGIAPTALK